jgi:hypothetical protein
MLMPGAFAVFSRKLRAEPAIKFEFCYFRQGTSGPLPKLPLRWWNGFFRLAFVFLCAF